MIFTRKYEVELVDIGDIKASPENDDLYGAVKRDTQMEVLIASIRERGLEEPLIISVDGYVISGHRRLFACRQLRWRQIPCRRKEVRRTDNLKTWHRTLAEYNPQRIKSPLSLLKEALLRNAKRDPRGILQPDKFETDVEYREVSGFKAVRKISPKKQQFLDAAKEVVNSLKKFWPLSVRQVHYKLLNDPPLISRPKNSKFDLETKRYRNDEKSYKALIELLKQARYAGVIPMWAIDDPTRPGLATLVTPRWGISFQTRQATSWLAIASTAS